MFREDDNILLKEERNFEMDNMSGENTLDTIFENTPVRFLTATSMLKDNVENSQGEKLGDIKDIMLDIQTGQIEYIVIEFGGFLGIGKKLFAVPLSALSIDPDRKIFILNKTKAELENAPGFDKDHWPETNSRHFEDVNYYWGYMGKGGIYNSDTGFTM